MSKLITGFRFEKILAEWKSVLHQFDGRVTFESGKMHLHAVSISQLNIWPLPLNKSQSSLFVVNEVKSKHFVSIVLMVCGYRRAHTQIHTHISVVHETSRRMQKRIMCWCWSQETMGIAVAKVLSFVRTHTQTHMLRQYHRTPFELCKTWGELVIWCQWMRECINSDCHLNALTPSNIMRTSARLCDSIKLCVLQYIIKWAINYSLLSLGICVPRHSHSHARVNA